MIWLTNSSVHILPNISKSTGNQKVKSGQVIEYNMRNIFLEKSYIKSTGKTSSQPFSKKIKIEPLDQQSRVSYSFFIVCPSGGLSQYFKTKVKTTCFSLIQSFFKKSKSGTSSPALFSAWFLKKNISHIILSGKISQSDFLKNGKNFFKMKYKTFSIIFKKFSLTLLKQTFLAESLPLNC